MFYCSTDGTQGEGTAGGYPAGGGTTDQCGYEANTEGSTLYLKICVYIFFSTDCTSKIWFIAVLV